MLRFPLRLRPATATAFVGALTAAVLAGCGGGDEQAPAAATLPVAVTLAPIQEAVEEIGGDAVSVTNLTPVGGQPHALDPSAGALAALKAAKLVVTIGPDFQPAVSKAVLGLPASTARVDLLGTSDVLPAPKPIAGERGEVEGSVTGGSDPHVWGSPKRMVAIVGQLRDALVKADPARRSTFERGATAYLAELGALDDRYRASLERCDGTVLLTTHPAFAYLAADYGLTQAVTAGISVAARPDPSSLRATRRYADRRGATTLFFSAPVPSRLQTTVKSGTGLAAATLNPIEGLTQDQVDAGDTYLTLMRRNLDALTEGLGCEPPAAGEVAPSSTPAGS